ncbi:CDP-glycerol glycerophosphotransferase family protein [Pediococcus siamensis]|uniref:CDP-glycerol glycerophosphotransferase family protein n=1 Tax=Pediococcus siamensis TaxID=381829 RepID=UPI0039A2581B
MRKIKGIIINNTLIAKFVICCVRVVFTILDKLIRSRKKQILFTSYSGRQFSDSPKVIYDSLINDGRFEDYKFVWGLLEPEKFNFFGRSEKVKINSFRYFVMLCQSKVWISNTSIERLFAYKKSKHIYINTWHGTPLKHLGKDENDSKYLVKNWYNNANFDLFTCSSEYDKKIFQRIFPKTPKSAFYEVGLPRNNELQDSLKSDGKEVKEKLYTHLKLDPQKKTILYTPTFRDESNDRANQLNERTLKNISAKYNLLIRGHYFVNRKNKLHNDYYVDVTDFKNINDLYIGSDLLVTDYSSTMFDYSILKKPIVLFVPDLEQYVSNGCKMLENTD